MMSLHNSTHSSQTNTEGPAISLRTSCWLLPQKEQYRSFSLFPSPLPVWLLSAILKPHYRLRTFIVPARMRVSANVCKLSTPVLPIFYLKSIAYPAESSPILGALFDNRVNQAESLGFLPVHEIVTVGIVLDLIHGAASMVDHDLVQALAHAQDFAGMDIEVRCLALKTTHGLMHHHA